MSIERSGIGFAIFFFSLHTQRKREFPPLGDDPALEVQRIPVVTDRLSAPSTGRHRGRRSSMPRSVRPSNSNLEAMKSLSATSTASPLRSEEHTSELQSRENLVCRLLLEKK